MKPARIGAAVLALVLAAATTRAGGEREEQQRLQGTWDMVELGYIGADKPSPFSKGRTVTFTGDKMHMTPKTTWVIRLAPTKQPPEIDMTITTGPSKDKVLKGIYKLERDTLTILYGPVTTGQRPSGFTPPAAEGKFLRMVLKRQPPQKKD
jgi:uncharacterized protein (TIGR03067 family)